MAASFLRTAVVSYNENWCLMGLPNWDQGSLLLTWIGHVMLPFQMQNQSIVYWLYLSFLLLIKSPQFGVTSSPKFGVTSCFQFISVSASASSATMTFASQIKTLWANLWYLGQRKYRSRKIYWVTFLWPWPKVMAVALINIKLLVCSLKWEPLNWSL